MATEDYPQTLPGVLVNSNAYTPQGLTRKNDLQSGFPTFRLEADNGWVMFDVVWSFSASEVQFFNAWHRYGLRNGSKAFNIGLMIDGWDGTTNTVEHECYFNTGTFKVTQVQRRWHVSTQLLAINRQTVSEEFYDQLAILDNGFPDGIPETIEEFGELLSFGIEGCLKKASDNLT